MTHQQTLLKALKAVAIAWRAMLRLRPDINLLDTTMKTITQAPERKIIDAPAKCDICGVTTVSPTTGKLLNRCHCGGELKTVITHAQRIADAERRGWRGVHIGDALDNSPTGLIGIPPPPQPGFQCNVPDFFSEPSTQ